MDITYESLYELYIIQKMSTRECAERFQRPQSTIVYFLKKFGIKGRPHTENKMPIKKGDKLSEEHKKAIAEAMTNNPNNWLNGKSLHLSPRWKGGKRVYRKMCLKRDSLICSLCGVRERKNKVSNLHVHHIDHDRNNNSLSNLVVLCASCHKLEHRNNDLITAKPNAIGKTISMIKVSDIEFMVPNRANPVGSVSFKLEMVVPLDEVKSLLVPNEEYDIVFSERTSELLEQLRKSIIRDFDKT